MDVEALYPSIRIERTAVVVGEMLEESKVEYENCDYETAVRFIASNSSQSDINRWGMHQYVQQRRHVKGNRPGPTTEELGRRRKYLKTGEEIPGESKWKVKRNLLTEKKKKSTGESN